jgi:competence protein ComEC
VLQVPHHGSLTSSSEQFIHRIKPQFAVFNVGYRNRFGFPKASIVKRYQQSGAQLLRTDEDGAVIFEFMEGDKKVSLTKARTKMFLWQR